LAIGSWEGGMIVELKDLRISESNII
jgi:hypothetical protein